MLSITLFYPVDSKSPSNISICNWILDSGLLDIRLGMDVYFSFIAYENIELLVPASYNNTFIWQYNGVMQQNLFEFCYWTLYDYACMHARKE